MTAMRLMTYNILYGGQDEHDFSRLERVKEVIAGEKPDVLVLQECMNFDANGGKLLYEMESKLGLRGFLAPARSDLHVCVFVRPEFKIRSFNFDTFNFHHALINLSLELPSGDVFTVVGTHLCPHGGTNRIVEVERIFRYAKEDRFVALLGDLNSLDHHKDHSDTLAKLKPRYRVRHLLPGETVADTRVTSMLEAAGYVDIVWKNSPAPDSIFTAPTKLESAGSEFHQMRVDYIYANQKLAERFKKCTVVKSALSDFASDHYPVVADFEL